MTQTTTTPQVTYRRTKAGDWVAFGPAADITPRQNVSVTKRDGTREVRTVREIGRTFRIDGVEMVYGYLHPRTVQRVQRDRNFRRAWAASGGGQWEG